jgi:exonuclease SbcC
MKYHDRLREILPGASIGAIETPGHLYKITRGKNKGSDSTLLVRFLEPEDDERELLEVDNKELEVLFYDEDINRWNIQLIWAVVDRELKDDVRQDLEQDTRYALRRSVDESDLPVFLTPISELKSEIQAVEETFDRGELIQNIIDENLTFLFEKDETARENRLKRLKENNPSEANQPAPVEASTQEGIIDEINLGSKYRQNASKRSISPDWLTLLHGKNGSGKTSLLDGTTLSMVGQSKRDEQRSNHYQGLEVSLVDEMGEVTRLSNQPGKVKQRIAGWYGYRPTGSADRHLEFYRVNYHEAGATTRFLETGSDQDLEETIQRYLYGDKLTEARDEKEKLEKEAYSKISDLEDEIADLEEQRSTKEQQLEKVQASYSKATTAAGNLSSVTRKLVQVPSSTNLEDKPEEEPQWTESWRLWEDRFTRIQIGIDTLDTTQPSHTIEGLQTAFDNKISELTRQRGILGEIERLEQEIATLQTLRNKFHTSPWDTLSPSSTFVAAVLSSRGIRLSDLQLLADEIGKLEEPINADTVAEWATTVEAQFENQRVKLEARKAALDDDTEHQANREELHAEIQTLTDQFLSISESIAYCPACYANQTIKSLREREQPTDFLQEKNGIPNALRSHLASVDDALTVLGEDCWEDIAHTIDARYGNICGLADLRELLSFTIGASRSQTLPTTTEDSVSLLGERLQEADGIKLETADLATHIQKIRETDERKRTEAMERVPRYDPGDEYVGDVIQDVVEQLDKLQVADSLLSDHIPSIHWDDEIAIVNDRRILEQTLNDIEESSALVNSITSLRDQITEYEQEIEEVTANKQDWEDGIERLQQAFSQTGGKKAFNKHIEDHMSAITTLFQAFQRPYEFDEVLLEDDTVRVSRRGSADDSEPVEKMSSGQRAALGLAIFMTNNLAHPTAPPVMLLDEPVAHLDDINTVSFFNLLISAATELDRQILFATANEDIANLLKEKIGDSDDFKSIDLDKTH